jgi:branched-chain amino acid transport system ATP-binding protein
LIGIALLAYRITQAQKMVAQYPWLYQRTGLLSWRELS